MKKLDVLHAAMIKNAGDTSSSPVASDPHKLFSYLSQQVLPQQASDYLHPDVGLHALVGGGLGAATGLAARKNKAHSAVRNALIGAAMAIGSGSLLSAGRRQGASAAFGDAAQVVAPPSE